MTDAILLCDLWDTHWCRTAAAGTARIAERAASVTAAFRAAGHVVIHAPSETMPFYAGHPARRYVVNLEPSPARTATESRLEAAFPPAPRPCSDNPPCPEPSGPPWPWTRQHPAIAIDADDAVLNSGGELLAVIADRGIEHVYVAGVHANLCVVHRPFGIAAMVGAGISCSLLGDLTEAMPPGFTAAALEHVARHWCPVVSSGEAI